MGLAEYNFTLKLDGILMNSSSISKQISMMLAGVSIIGTILFILLVSNDVNTRKMSLVESQAQELITRSAQMFMVSTVKFHEIFSSEPDPIAKQTILEDWNRTIEAVDIAVTNDFGAAHSKVRLFSNPMYVKTERLGKAATLSKGPTELEALKRFSQGDAEMVYMDEDVYTLAVPLYSDMHPGCANCHSIDVQKHELLGGVSATIPMAKVNAEAEQTIWMAAIFIIIALFSLLATIYLFLGRRVIKPLSMISNQSRHISESIESGNVDHRVDAKGNAEIATLTDSFNGLLSVVKSLFDNLKLNSGHVYQAAEKTSDMAQSQEQVALKQQDSIQSIVTALSELQKAGDLVSNRALNTADTSSEVSQFVSEGRQTMQQTVDAINALANEVNKASDVIEALDKRSDSIGSIISTIDGIAEQTNLLALNAAIEAARAGEQGRGFAVVADEVRTLAQRTQSATSEINQLINNLQSDARTASSVMGSSTNKAVATVDVAQQALEKLDEITQQVEVINSMNSDIAAASEEQVTTIADINNNLQTVSEVTNNSVEAAQSMSSESESLKHLSKQMLNHA